MEHLTKEQLDQIANLWSAYNAETYIDFDCNNDYWNHYKEKTLYHAFLSGMNFYKNWILNSGQPQTKLEEPVIPKEYNQEIRNEYPDTLTVKDVAKLWKMSESRIYVLTGLKLIPSHRIGARVVFYRDEIMKLIDSGFRVTMEDERNARKKMQEIRGIGIKGRKKYIKEN